MAETKLFRKLMAEVITEQGDKLVTLEDFNDGFIVIWVIYDRKSAGDPFGRAPQYQVWRGDQRCYVGSNMNEAYADFNRIKDDFIAAWAMP